MPRADYIFPPGFLWGCATAAHQVEGRNTNNDWYAWEQLPGKIQDGGSSERASDWWSGRWKEDFDRAAETGQNAHRLSVEWSRIQPTPDRWDEDALDHYREILRGLVQRGLMPMVTLHHFTNPLWLSEQGGWENPKAPKWFAAYTRKVVEALKEYVSLWCTINEPNVYVGISYMDGAWPPGKNDHSRRLYSDGQPVARPCLGLQSHSRNSENRPGRGGAPLPPIQTCQASLSARSLDDEFDEPILQPGFCGLHHNG